MLNRKAPKKLKDLNYLVANYDSCAATVYGTHPKLISKPFIAFAAEHNFDGFYGLSGRHFTLDIPNDRFPSFLDRLVDKAASNGKPTYSKKIIQDNYKTTAITSNFVEATGLLCQGVSTGEDLLKGRHCSDGFYKIIAPYEAEIGFTPTRDEVVHVADLKKAGVNLSKSKNALLSQIAQDAAEKNPGHTIHLDVAIANKYCAEAAKDAWKDPSWPKNVIINVYRVLGDGDRAEITPIFKMSAEQIAELKKRKTHSVEETKVVESKQPNLACKPAAPLSKKIESAAVTPVVKKDESEKKQQPASMFSKPKTSLVTHGTFSRRVTRSMAKAAEEVKPQPKKKR